MARTKSKRRMLRKGLKETKTDSPYFCTKCERSHRVGTKIWERHKKYKK